MNLEGGLGVGGGLGCKTTRKALAYFINTHKSYYPRFSHDGFDQELHGVRVEGVPD